MVLIVCNRDDIARTNGGLTDFLSCLNIYPRLKSTIFKLRGDNQ